MFFSFIRIFLYLGYLYGLVVFFLSFLKEEMVKRVMMDSVKSGPINVPHSHCLLYFCLLVVYNKVFYIFVIFNRLSKIFGQSGDIILVSSSIIPVFTFG